MSVREREREREREKKKVLRVNQISCRLIRSSPTFASGSIATADNAIMVIVGDTMVSCWCEAVKR